jgi:hypothetical protein
VSRKELDQGALGEGAWSGRGPRRQCGELWGRGLGEGGPEGRDGKRFEGRQNRTP